jgi:hypothetical protein
MANALNGKRLVNDMLRKLSSYLGTARPRTRCFCCLESLIGKIPPRIRNQPAQLATPVAIDSPYSSA